MELRVWAYAAALLAAVAAGPAGAVPYYFTTGQTGAQTQIDMNHTTSWSFTASSAWTLGGGRFTMKDGSATSATVALTLYEGGDATGTLLQQQSFTTAGFCAQHGGNCQNFTETAFDFATAYTFTTGRSYYLALTSTSVDAQSQAYFIKGLDSVTIASGGTVLAGQTFASGSAVTTPTTPVVVPEPGSLAVLGVAVLGAMRARRRAG